MRRRQETAAGEGGSASGRIACRGGGPCCFMSRTLPGTGAPGETAGGLPNYQRTVAGGDFLILRSPGVLGQHSGPQSERGTHSSTN